MSKYQAGKIMSEEKPPDKGQFCCIHKNIVPLEIGFANKTYPQGYKAEPYYNFAVGILSSNIIRVKTYLCLDCKQEIKAPNPGQLKKDRI
jgi:hypothetical protein